jgi:hypothetical protein
LGKVFMMELASFAISVLMSRPSSCFWFQM